MSALSDATKGTTKKRLEDFMEEPMRNRDVIALAKFPDSHRRDESDLAPIEREDWPAPNAAAAAYPELRKWGLGRGEEYVKRGVGHILEGKFSWL